MCIFIFKSNYMYTKENENIPITSKDYVKQMGECPVGTEELSKYLQEYADLYFKEKMADIRNRLSPVKNILTMIDQGSSERCVLDQLDTAQESVDYITGLGK